MRHLPSGDGRTALARWRHVVRDLWMAKRGRQAHHKRHHDTPDRCTTVIGRPQRGVVRPLRSVMHPTVVRMATEFRVYDGRTTRLLGSYPTRTATGTAAMRTCSTFLRP